MTDIYSRIAPSGFERWTVDDIDAPSQRIYEKVTQPGTQRIPQTVLDAYLGTFLPTYLTTNIGAYFGPYLSGLPSSAPGSASLDAIDLRTIFLPSTKYCRANTGADVTAALNTFLADAYTARKIAFFEPGLFKVSQAGTIGGQAYCLLNPGAPIMGSRGDITGTVIFPASTVGSSVDILRTDLTGATNSIGEGLFIEDIKIYPAGADGSTKRGGVALRVKGITGSQLSWFRMQGVSCEAGNDYSVVWENVTPTSSNQQGQPATALMMNCKLIDGFKGAYLGDSNKWELCYFGSTSTARSAFDFLATNYNASFPSGIGNIPSVQHIINNRFGGLGPWITLHNGRNIIVENINAEFGNESGSTGGTYQAGIVALGDVGRVVGLQIFGGQASAFGNTTATSLIRLENAHGAIVRDIELSCGTASPIAAGVYINDGAGDVTIGRLSSKDLTKFDSGLVAKTAPADPVGGSFNNGLNLNSPFTAAGAPYTSPSFQRVGGRVYLKGAILINSAATGAGIGNLPAGFCPAEANRCPALAYNASSVLTPIEVRILADGSILYYGPGSSMTVFFLDGINFPVIDFATWPQPAA